jgi:hypothetical protein
MAGARKILLPRLVVTKIANAGDPHVECISLPTTAPDEAYYVCPLQTEDTDKRLDGKPRWQGTRFNLFPVVLDATGVPWAEATVYLLARMEGAIAPSMSTYASIADDLAAYHRFLDETGLDWPGFQCTFRLL